MDSRGGAMATSSTKGPSPDPVAVLRAHRAAVNVVAFHEPSGTLLSGDADGELKIWDLVRHRPVSSSRVHNPSAGVLGIGVSPSLDNRIISQGRDGTVKCWQLTESSLSRQPLLTIKSESYHFCKLSLAKDVTTVPALAGTLETIKTLSGKVLMAMVGKDTSTIEIWDIDAGKCVQQLSPESSSSGMCMSLQLLSQPDEEGLCTVIAGFEDGSMLVWDMRQISAPLIRVKFHVEPVLSIVISGGGTEGVSASADGNLLFFSLDYQKNVCIAKKKIEGQAGVGDIALRCDDKILATAGWDYRVRVYDYRRKKPLAILKYHKDLVIYLLREALSKIVLRKQVNGVTFSDDTRWMASCSRDSTIALWSLYPPEEHQKGIK